MLCGVRDASSRGAKFSRACKDDPNRRVPAHARFPLRPFGRSEAGGGLNAPSHCAEEKAGACGKREWGGCRISRPPSAYLKRRTTPTSGLRSCWWRQRSRLSRLGSCVSEAGSDRAWCLAAIVRLASSKSCGPLLLQPCCPTSAGLCQR